MDSVFPNRSEDEEIHPLTTTEIATAQMANATYKHLFKRSVLSVYRRMEMNGEVVLPQWNEEVR
jgi:hypothetical protein